MDDLHVGLPGWVIHTRPVNSDSPVYTTTTDGTGKFVFPNLTPGTWLVWEDMQEGWTPVTSASFTVEVPPGPGCVQVRFKNRQATSTPTPVPPSTSTPTPGDPTSTPTRTPTRTPTPQTAPTFTPTPTRTPTPAPGGVCVTGRVEVTIWGEKYSYSLVPDGNAKILKPLPWQTSTTLNIVNYTGPVTWTQYAPTWKKQVGGYSFTYPGGLPGAAFSIFIITECGEIMLISYIDDPTATPTPRAVSGPFKTFLPVQNRKH